MSEQHLAQLLKQLILQTEKLNTILKEERTALEKANLDSITEIVDEKNRLLTEVDVLTKQTGQALTKQGFPNNIVHLEQYINNVSGQEQEVLLALADALREKLTDMRLNNEINGRIVATSQKNIEVLSKIFGHFVEESETYDPTGKLKKTSQKHSLSKA